TDYLSLVRSCAGGEGRATASSIETCAEPGCTPPAGLEFGDEGADVALLQWDLAYLGFITTDNLANGSGSFRPLTLDAVVAFQQDKDVQANAYNGTLTAAA